MKQRRIAILIAGALTSALVLGSIGYAYGETTDGTTGGVVGVMGRAGGGLVRVVADLTKLDEADVARRRADGESFAAIAQSKGVGTDEVKDAAVADFEESIDERLTSTDPVHGPRGRGGMMGRAGARPESVLADLSGLDESDIRKAREDGKSLAEIAKAEGVDINKVIDTTVKQAEEDLQAAVKDGRMDADRVDTMLDNMRSHLEEMANETALPSFRGGRGGGFHGGPAGPSGDDV